MQPWEWGEEGEFHHLMASQQRDLRRLVEDRVVLEEDDFVLTQGDGSWAGWLDHNVPVVVYEREESFFGLTYIPLARRISMDDPSGHAVHFRPGKQTPDELHARLEWEDVCRYFGDWLGYIARELDLDDDAELEDDEVGDEEDDEPEQGDEGDEEYEDAEEAPAPSVVASTEPDPPVPEDFDEPEPIPTTPLTAASTPTPDVPPRELPPPSWFYRASNWAKVQKEKHGVLWVVIAFIVGLIVTILAALL